MVDKVSIINTIIAKEKASGALKSAAAIAARRAELSKMTEAQCSSLLSNTTEAQPTSINSWFNLVENKHSSSDNIWAPAKKTTETKIPFVIKKGNKAPAQTPTESPKSIADNLFTLADENSAAVSLPIFTKYIDKINKNNVLDVIDAYDKKSPNESLIEMICNEKGSSNTVRQDAISKVFNALAQKAKEVGVDIAPFQNQFNAELNIQFRQVGFTDTTKMDTILNAVVQATKNKASLTPQERKTIKSTNSVELEKQATGILEHRAKSAQSSFDKQMKEDGWAGDVADFTSGLWNSKNRAKVVRTDISKFNNQIKQLQTAETKGSNAYNAKFYETFGVEYDAENIAIYKKKEQQNQFAMAVYGIESNFNATTNSLLKTLSSKKKK